MFGSEVACNTLYDAEKLSKILGRIVGAMIGGFLKMQFFRTRLEVEENIVAHWIMNELALNDRDCSDTLSFRFV